MSVFLLDQSGETLLNASDGRLSDQSFAKTPTPSSRIVTVIAELHIAFPIFNSRLVSVAEENRIVLVGPHPREVTA